MRIQVVGRTAEIDDGLHGFVEHQLLLALGRVSPGVHCAVVRLCDQYGPRGGIDRTCRIEVRLRSRRSLVVEHTDTNLYAAISRAAERAKRAVVQEKGRFRRHRKGNMPAQPRRHLDQVQKDTEYLSDTKDLRMTGKADY